MRCIRPCLKCTESIQRLRGSSITGKPTSRFCGLRWNEKAYGDKISRHRSHRRFTLYAVRSNSIAGYFPGCLPRNRAASGILEAVGWHKIEAAGLRGFFSFGCFSDKCEERAGIFRSALQRVKGQLGPRSRSLFVGDTPSDIRAAREAGVPILAVSTGTFGFEELSACSPDWCVPHCGFFRE